MKLLNKIKEAYHKVYVNLIEGRDLWQLLLNIAVVVAIVGGLVSAIISVALKNSPIAIAAFVATCLFGVVCLTLSIRSKDIIYAAVLFCLVADFILFPVMFFTSGGIHGGMPIWMVLGLVIGWVVIRNNKILYIVYGLGLAFQCGCILYAEYHPISVISFESERAVVVDVIQSLILVSLIFGTVFRLYSHAYEKKKQELDSANAQLSEANERITFQAMYTLAKTIDAKDRYTKGHSMRVAEYSGMIAKRLGLSSEEVEEITNMALLHDIGKIGVPDAIINKPSKLSADEYYIIQKHPGVGFDILSEMPEMKDIGVGARWHHERYDGTGYPDGLKGTEIPLPARIIGVADAYDAMTSNRSYRKFLSQENVKRELEEGRGTQFDPGIVDIMLQIVREDKLYALHEQ